MIDGLRAERRVSTRLRGSLTAALLRRSGGMNHEGRTRPKIAGLVGATQPEASQPGAHRSSAVRKASIAACCSAHATLLRTRPCHHNVFPGVMNHTHY